MKKIITAMLIFFMFISNFTLVAFAKDENERDDSGESISQNINDEAIIQLTEVAFNGEDIDISGWIGTNQDKYVINVKIDDQKIDSLELKDNQDIPEYIENFRFKENFMLSTLVSEFDDGEHTILVEVLTENRKVIAHDEKNFTVNKNKEAQVDDVQSSDEGVKDGDLSNTIKPSELVTNEILSESKIKNNLNERINPQANMFLDTFTFSNKVLKLSGWSMCNVSNSYVQVVVDGKILDAEASRSERGDVIGAIHGFGDINENPKPGFTSELTLNNLSYGDHEINIRTVVGTTVLSNIVKTISVEYPKAMINFENMKVSDGILKVSGWSMSNVEDTYMQLLIDGKIVASNLTRDDREDVLSAIKGYGDKQQNPKPGFQSEYDISALKKGTHEIQVRVIHNGVVLSAAYKTLLVEEAKNRVQIENTDVNNGILSVSGWAMSGINNTYLRALIDGGVVKTKMNRVPRGDVLEAIKDCGTSKQNPLPGFDEHIDITNFGTGTHVLDIQIMQGSEIIASEKKTIYIQPYSSMVFIDNASIKDHMITINGWALSNHPNMNLALFVNGVKVDAKIQRSKRDDVIAAIKGYGDETQNPTPGYNLKADLNGFPSGKNEIQIRAMYGSNLLSAQTITVMNDAYKTNMNIDEVKMTGNKVSASGWVMSDNRSNRVQFLVDGVVVADNITRTQRADVQEGIIGFGNASDNPTPGFTGSADLSKFSPGNHNFQVRVVSKTGELLAARTQLIRTRGTGNLGVDVSEHNGYIDFAIIRAGWGYYTEDKSFRSNIKGCEQNNVPYGIYFYSYALNMDQAKKEVDGLLKALEGTNPELPVYIDMEDADGYKVRNGFPSNEMLQNICAYFCERVSAAGYKTGIYASLSWFNTYLNSSKLDKYDKWVAQWNTECDYQKPYYMWQFTSDGSVPGISSARVDMNYSYY